MPIRESPEAGLWHFSASFLHGFVVSANLRNTCWSFYRGKWQSPQISATLHKTSTNMRRTMSKPWLAKLPIPGQWIRGLPLGWGNVTLLKSISEDKLPYLWPDKMARWGRGMVSQFAIVARQLFNGAHEHWYRPQLGTPCGGEVWHGVTSGVSREMYTTNRHRWWGAT